MGEHRPEDYLDADPESADSAIGQDLFDLSGSFAGTLFKRGPQFRFGEANAGGVFLRRPDGSTVRFEGGEFLTAFGGQPSGGYILGPEGNIIKTISGADARRLLDSGTGRSGGSAALSFQQQLDLQESGQAFQTGLQESSQEFQAEQQQGAQLFSAGESELARENQQRLSLQSEINSLIGQAVSIRQRSQELLAQTLGQDPFRSGAMLRGQVQRGTSPTQAFRTQLHQTAEFEAPNVNFNAPISTLQGQAQDIRDFVTTGLPGQPAFGGPGLARGGVVDMEKGKDGKFGVRKFGETGQSILVGENGPEVATFNKGKVTITPLIGGAAHGATFQQSDLNPSPGGFIQAVGPALGAAGFQDAPVFGRDRSGFLSPARREIPGGLNLSGIANFVSNRPADFGATALQRLGVQPRLVRNAETGAIFFQGDDGQFRHIPNMAAFRSMEFRPEDVVSLSPESFRTLGINPAGTLTERGSIEESTSFGPFSSPFLAPIGDNRFVGLPDPASFTRSFNRLDRASQLGILSAFGTAGVGLDDFFARQDFFTPSGSARAGSTLSLG